jgi:KipI family sensor histidine kinase inhibitor
VTLPVSYDGPDLAVVAEATGLAVDEVVRLHAATVYTAAFTGFAPGFAYLTGLPEQLQLPRRAEPRTRVPAGSVAVADVYTAVYPRESPGGWNLLGTTDAVLFDPDRVPAALLPPGTRVRFAPR